MCLRREGIEAEGGEKELLTFRYTSGMQTLQTERTSREGGSGEM